jgi:hypothetical protein
VGSDREYVVSLLQGHARAGVVERIVERHARAASELFGDAKISGSVAPPGLGRHERDDAQSSVSHTTASRTKAVAF